jgi:hypothetical protein
VSKLSGEGEFWVLTWTEMQRCCISPEAWVGLYLAAERRAQSGYILFCPSTPVAHYSIAILAAILIKLS